jgi:hypothetical protein
MRGRRGSPLWTFVNEVTLVIAGLISEVFSGKNSTPSSSMTPFCIDNNCDIRVKKGMAWTQLSKAFQDAILTTEKLGLCYI